MSEVQRGLELFFFFFFFWWAQSLVLNSSFSHLLMSSVLCSTEFQMSFFLHFLYITDEEKQTF